MVGIGDGCVGVVECVQYDSTIGYGSHGADVVLATHDDASGVESGIGLDEGEWGCEIGCQCGILVNHKCRYVNAR